MAEIFFYTFPVDNGNEWAQSSFRNQILKCFLIDSPFFFLISKLQIFNCFGQPKQVLKRILYRQSFFIDYPAISQKDPKRKLLCKHDNVLKELLHGRGLCVKDGYCDAKIQRDSFKRPFDEVGFKRAFKNQTQTAFRK